MHSLRIVVEEMEAQAESVCLLSCEPQPKLRKAQKQREPDGRVFNQSEVGLIDLGV
jgi:hypothetical protein